MNVYLIIFEEIVSIIGDNWKLAKEKKVHVLQICEDGEGGAQ